MWPTSENLTIWSNIRFSFGKSFCLDKELFSIPLYIKKNLACFQWTGIISFVYGISFQYIVAVIWLFASVCAVSVLFGLYDYNRGDAMSQELSSLYTALARTVWALSVGWVIYACSTGYGGENYHTFLII